MELAPISAEVTRGSRMVHVNASWASDCRRDAVRHERIQREMVIDLVATRRVEPQLVANDPAAQFAAVAVSLVGGVGTIDALRSQGVEPAMRFIHT